MPVRRVGKAQMKTQDGGPVCRDADFLAETRTLPREQADRYVRPQVFTANHLMR